MPGKNTSPLKINFCIKIKLKHMKMINSMSLLFALFITIASKTILFHSFTNEQLVIFYDHKIIS